MKRLHISAACIAASVFSCVTFLSPVAAEAQQTATPLGPATWGNPNQPWGVRRLPTEADKALIASYRSGKKHPILEENFTNPAELQTLWALQSDDNPGLRIQLRRVRAGLRVLLLSPKLLFLDHDVKGIR